MSDSTLPVLIVVAIVVLYLINSIKILREYERGVIFRLGRALTTPKGPGIIFVFRPIDQIVRISLRQEVLEVPPQDVITRDNVTIKVNAVLSSALAARCPYPRDRASSSSSGRSIKLSASRCGRKCLKFRHRT